MLERRSRHLMQYVKTFKEEIFSKFAISLKIVLRQKKSTANCNETALGTWTFS